MDLKESFDGGGAAEVREKWENWVEFGILTLLGGGEEKRAEILGWGKNWVGERVEKAKEAVENGMMASGFCVFSSCDSGFSADLRLGSI